MYQKVVISKKYISSSDSGAKVTTYQVMYFGFLRPRCISLSLFSNSVFLPTNIRTKPTHLNIHTHQLRISAHQDLTQRTLHPISASWRLENEHHANRILLVTHFPRPCPSSVLSISHKIHIRVSVGWTGTQVPG
jgi:hypothetical protein